jgi:hypothetical protein
MSGYPSRLLTFLGVNGRDTGSLSFIFSCIDSVVLFLLVWPFDFAGPSNGSLLSFNPMENENWPGFVIRVAVTTVSAGAYAELSAVTQRCLSCDRSLQPAEATNNLQEAIYNAYAIQQLLSSPPLLEFYPT